MGNVVGINCYLVYRHIQRKSNPISYRKLHELMTSFRISSNLPPSLSALSTVLTSFSSLTCNRCSIPRIKSRTCSIWESVASFEGALAGAGDDVAVRDGWIVVLNAERTWIGEGVMSREACILRQMYQVEVDGKDRSQHTCQFSPASFVSSRSSIFSLFLLLHARKHHPQILEHYQKTSYLSNSVIHLSFSLCVPCNNNSKCLYSFSSS